jgi:hypothetical protein
MMQIFAGRIVYLHKLLQASNESTTQADITVKAVQQR